MHILGIETSCDETSASVLEAPAFDAPPEGGFYPLSNVIASQVEIHARYGGVVPEIASRQHLLQITPILRRSLEQAGCTWDDIDGIAVTSGPGLAGALLVGVNAAKAVAFALGLPIIGVNHLESHIYANWVAPKPDAPLPTLPTFPLLCLIASGGHTDLVLMRGHGDYRILGRTRDDAAGEAFDKAARVLGLGYPGGPLVQKTAESAAEPLPLPRAWMKGSNDFSFSGLKTAVLHAAQEQGLYPEGHFAGSEDERKRLVASIAAGFQEAVVDVLVQKTIAAAREEGVSLILLAGGVAANKPLREQLKARSPIPVIIPPPVMCTDNAAMVACAGYHHLQRGDVSGMALDVRPNWRIIPV